MKPLSWPFWYFKMLFSLIASCCRVLLYETIPLGMSLHAKLSHILFTSFPNSLMQVQVLWMLLYLEKAAFCKGTFYAWLAIWWMNRYLLWFRRNGRTVCLKLQVLSLRFKGISFVIKKIRTWRTRISIDPYQYPFCPFIHSGLSSI